MKNSTPRRLPSLLLAAALSGAVFQTVRASERQASTATNRVAEALEIPGIHNAFRATQNIYSGSQPEGEAGFASLQKLGIKTIVSVDGSKPDVKLAHQYGLRYVHLPFGYDGVPTNRVAELAKLTAEFSGPFFVHCHHGKHRGPTAVAVMCEAAQGWTPHQGVAFLRQAGTADDYPGLYRSAREFKAPTVAQLAAVGKPPEIARTPSLVDAMVAIDVHFDHLKQSQAAGWKIPAGHADISPEHEATMLWEQLREIARMPDTAQRPQDFRTELQMAEDSADKLRKLLKKRAGVAELESAFKQAGQSCSACHKKYRNE